MRWLRRRRTWLMRGSAELGSVAHRWPIWLALGVAAAVVVWMGVLRTTERQALAEALAAQQGLQRDNAQQQADLSQLRARLAELEAQLQTQRQELGEAQALGTAAHSQALSDQAASAELARQLRVLEQDNARLKNDLSFFQSVIPTAGVKRGVSLRNFEAQRLAPTQLRWQALVLQPVKNASQWSGELSVVAQGSLAGKPWSQGLAGPAMAVNLVQYVRLEGGLSIPEELVLQSVSARLTQGKRVIAVQTFKF